MKDLPRGSDFDEDLSVEGEGLEAHSLPRLIF